MSELIKDIRKESSDSLKKWLESRGHAGFRAKQIQEWIWAKGVSSFDEMSNLPKELRNDLNNYFQFRNAIIAVKKESKDRTIKVAFRLHDSNLVEGVLIPSGNRMTACVSSQVGCSLNCKFCATGYMKRARNLDAAEIVDQVRLLGKLAEEHYGYGLSNIVYMGMGEPMLNYSEVMESISKITDPACLGISPQRITISTAGIVKMIYKLADDNPGVHLALSLHAATNESRSALMPINEHNNLDMLADAMKYFYQKTGKRPTLEYTVMDSINDREQELLSLASYAKRFPCKINLIEYNPISFADYMPAVRNHIDLFAARLSAYGLIVNVRRSRGKDIDAACGQLVLKSE